MSRDARVTSCSRARKVVGGAAGGALTAAAVLAGVLDASASAPPVS